MMQRLAARAVASTLIFTLTYSPVLGKLTDTAAMAQTVQNSTTSYAYDTLGNVTQITDPLGHVTTLSYDAQSRVIQELQPPAVTGAVGPAVKYSYDGQDQISTVTDPRSLVTSYANDGLGNQSALTSPDTGTSGNTYDAAGNLLTSTDALKRVTTYTYDALNRVTTIAYATTAATKFEYDGGATPTPNAIGHLTKMTDVSGITTYAYDQHGRLITLTQSISRSDGPDVRVTGYAYGTTGTSIGKLVGLTYPSGNRIVYDYDAAGRVQSLTLQAPDGTSKVLLSGIRYAPFGPVQSWTWGNDNSTMPSRYVRTFDLDGRITSYPLGNLAANGLVRTVGYDAAGRVTGYTHTAGVAATTPAAAFDQTFGYDKLDRLTSVVTATGGQSYAYDLNGNRTQVAYGANSYAYTISPTSNILTATSGPLPARTFLYDTTGSLTSDRPIAYTYRDNGRLSSMSKSATESAAYSYNGLGQRVNKRSSVAIGGTNTYVYDPAGHLLGEYVAKGAALEETVYLGDQPVAVLVPQGASTAAYYVFADQIDTPRVITNPTDNAMVWRWDNADPFGVGYPTESPAGATAFVYNLRFPGQLYDKETNTHYNYFRDYDPQTGRYVQSDPIGLWGGINTYVYVGANPISGIDSRGLKCSAAGGKVSCQYPGQNGVSFTVAATPGFPSSLGSDNWFYHKYDVSEPIGNADRQCILDELRKHPTPGNSNGASDGGTWNDANVGPFHNPVKSYTTSDVVTGSTVIVNLTTSGGVFADGYVARGIAGGNVHTWGEGDSPWQSPDLTGHDTQFMANQLVWGKQMEAIVKKCSCEK